jgi:hypothetical protein
MIRFGVTPEINAIATIVVLVSFVLVSSRSGSGGRSHDGADGRRRSSGSKASLRKSFGRCARSTT